MAELTGHVAVVTGASAGIGAATVTALAAAGAEVHAVARRAPRLQALSDETGCIPHALDVTDRAGLADLALDVAPTIFVANAGLGAGITGLMDAAPEDIETTIATNVTAVLQGLALFLPAMVEQGAGHAVLIGSVAGLYPNRSAIYGASKGAVHVMGWNLRRELAGTGVRVTEILPGRVASEFYDASVADAAARAALKHTGIRELQPNDVADAILYALTAPAHVNVSAIELQPLEQSFGGVNFDPLNGADPARLRGWANADTVKGLRPGGLTCASSSSSSTTRPNARRRCASPRGARRARGGASLCST